MAEDKRIQQSATGVGDRLPAEDDPAPARTGADVLAQAGPLSWNVPWSGAEILAILCVAWIVPGLMYSLFLNAGWYHRFYGAEFFERLKAGDATTQQLA